MNPLFIVSKPSLLPSDWTYQKACLILSFPSVNVYHQLLHLTKFSFCLLWSNHNASSVNGDELSRPGKYLSINYFIIISEAPVFLNPMLVY